jgi:hypothetical protein
MIPRYVEALMAAVQFGRGSALAAAKVFKHQVATAGMAAAECNQKTRPNNQKLYVNHQNRTVSGLTTRADSSPHVAGMSIATFARERGSSCQRRVIGEGCQ